MGSQVSAREGAHSGDDTRAPTDDAPAADAEAPAEAADAAAGPDRREDAAGEAPRTAPAGHRLRDLSPRGRLLAAALALALVSAHAYAVVRFAGDWVPTGDTALMGLRSFDSLTRRIPLVGQPSTSGMYGGLRRNAFHPGPMHVYLMAPVVRLLGLTAGMLTVSVVITASSLLVTAWAVFRRLGARAGVLGAVVLSLVVFTTGPGSLVFPVSSSISGYPLLAGAALVWCVVAGDDRLLPLAVVYLSFAGQAHLAVAPTVGVLAATAVVGLAVHWRHALRAGGAERRRVLRLGGGSLLLALALWSPVLVEEVRGDPGNLTAIATFASDGGRASVGGDAAVRQLAHTLGWPPLLGRTALTGADLLAPVGAVTWVTAAAVVVALVAAGLRWRRTAPARALLPLMALPLAAAGLYSGSNVPDSMEQVRLPFYHWVWPLTLVVALTLALAAVDLARALAPRAMSHVTARASAGRGAALLAGAAVVAVLVPVAVTPALDRPSDELPASGTFTPRWAIDALADQVMAVDGGTGPPEPVVIVPVGGNVFAGTDAALAMRLAERGVDIRWTLGLRDFVADEHVVDLATVGSVVVVAAEGIGDPSPDDIPGEQVGVLSLVDGLDRDDHTRLVAAFAGVSVDDLAYGPELTAYVERGDEERTLAEALLAGLVDDPAGRLQDRGLVEFLLEHPLASPALDPDALAALRDSLPAEGPLEPAATFTLHLVTGEEAADVLRPGGWAGRQATLQAEANGLIPEDRDRRTT